MHSYTNLDYVPPRRFGRLVQRAYWRGYAAAGTYHVMKTGRGYVGYLHTRDAPHDYPAVIHATTLRDMAARLERPHGR